jgi:tetratricopeptide (TPR) repeat protein
LKQRLSVSCLLLLLLCGWKELQPLAEAAEISPAWGSEVTYEPREGGEEREVRRWRCLSETPSEPVLKSSSTSSILQVVLLKAEDAKKPRGASQWFYLKAAILISKNFPQYFQCGRPFDLQKLQKTISEVNTTALQEALKSGETSREELNRIATQYTLAPTSSMGSDGVLSLEVVGKVIQDVQISTRCDWKNNTIDTSGTIAVRGQKPDASIYRALGLGKGDRYPTSAKEDEIMIPFGELEALSGIQYGFAIDGDPDKLTWVICVWQKSEAELAMAEARQINVQDSESARQAIAKYQEALTWMRRPRIFSKQAKPKKFSLMEIRGGRFWIESTDESAALSRIATIYSQLGEFYQALNYYNQALTTIRQDKTRTDIKEEDILIAISDIYVTLGDRKQAYRLYEQALSILLAQSKRQSKGEQER